MPGTQAAKSPIKWATTSGRAHPASSLDINSTLRPTLDPTLTLTISLREREIRNSVSDRYNLVNEVGNDSSVSILLFYNAISLWCGMMCQGCVKRCHYCGLLSVIIYFEY